MYRNEDQTVIPNLVKVCKLEFSSRVVEDLIIKALICTDSHLRLLHICSEARTQVLTEKPLVLRQTEYCAEPSGCIYVDEFAITVKTTIKHFQDNGGCDVFKDPEQDIVSSVLWQNTVI